jgi:hypothetical protein
VWKGTIAGLLRRSAEGEIAIAERRFSDARDVASEILTACLGLDPSYATWAARLSCEAQLLEAMVGEATGNRHYAYECLDLADRLARDASPGERPVLASEIARRLSELSLGSVSR